MAPVGVGCGPLGSANQYSTLVLESKELLLWLGAGRSMQSGVAALKRRCRPWIPACVGMTEWRAGMMERDDIEMPTTIRGAPRRPVSRVLYPALRKGRTAVIYLGPPLPTGSSGQPGDGPDSLVPLLGLAPDGVCLASNVTIGAVSSYLAISPLPECGRCVSVALSVGSPRPAVSGHPVQRSSDFPLPRSEPGQRPPGHLGTQ